VSLQVAARAVGGDELEHRALLAGGFAVGDLRTGAAIARSAAGGGNAFLDRRVRDVARLASLETVEPAFPLGANAVGVDQVLLIQVFDVGGVGAELRRLRKLLQETFHVWGRDSEICGGWGCRTGLCAGFGVGRRPCGTEPDQL